MHTSAAKKVISDIVLKPEKRLVRHMATIEQIITRFKLILKTRDRVAYACWPETNSFELSALLWLIDTYVCGNGEKAQWDETPPVTAALRALGFNYSVKFSPLGQLVAGSTTWKVREMIVQINSALASYLHEPLKNIDGFYSDVNTSETCRGCNTNHATRNIYSDHICPFKDVRLRSNHVGKVNCRRVGCLLETLLHEFCHVVEFSYRCITNDVHSWGAHNADDDKNELFLKIRGILAPAHETSFNNLLHSNRR